MRHLILSTLQLVVLTTAVTVPLAFADERVVIDDAERKVTVPESPERIVVLHEPLLGVPMADLGIVPVGSYGRADDGGSLMAVDFYRTVLGKDAPAPKGIGPVGGIDIEKLRALRPDLIVCTEYDLDKAKRFSGIAPVYVQNSSTGRIRGFESEASLARLLGREAVFDERKAEYQQRLAQVRESLPEDPHGKTYLAILLTDQLNALGEMSGVVQAVEDLGYTRLKLEKQGLVGLGSTLLVPLSPELVGKLDPDLLILMNSYAGKNRDEAGIRTDLDRILPGWERFLKPAREGRILFLDSVSVTTPSIASAEHTLDAIAEWVADRERRVEK
ncbi:ABC transporter substrate-binding protein [Billgrantia azerbaijanica]|nr:ABC transporter substrate-binding protein [Halomonas azerbaijanica]